MRKVPCVMTQEQNWPVAGIAAIRSILEHHSAFHWTVQGFGFIRTYLDADKRWRLNVWHNDLRVPNVSAIHDHPWDFVSYIIAGRMMNTKYFQEPGKLPTHNFFEIITGEGGGPSGETYSCTLSDAEHQVYVPGNIYSQIRTEIHETRFTDGTVTLNDRSPPTPDHKARVFWPVGEKWVDAIPRDATKEEIELAVGEAKAQVSQHVQVRRRFP